MSPRFQPPGLRRNRLHIPLTLVYTLSLIATHFDTICRCNVAVRGSRHDDKFRVFESLPRRYRSPTMSAARSGALVRSAGVRRLLSEAQELERDDCSDYAAAPLEVSRRPETPSLGWPATASKTDAYQHTG